MVGPIGAKWIWSRHIDTSSPNPDVAVFLLPYLQGYDALVFTMREFFLPELHLKQIAFIAPAIDPLSTKNMDLPEELCREVIANADVPALLGAVREGRDTTPVAAASGPRG